MSADQTVAELFRECLGLAADVDLQAVGYRKTKGWDSLAHMQLVGALESKFDIMLETQDVLDMSDFPKALEIVRKYRVDN